MLSDGNCNRQCENPKCPNLSEPVGRTIYTPETTTIRGIFCLECCIAIMTGRWRPTYQKGESRMARELDGTPNSLGPLEDWTCPLCGYSNTDHLARNTVMCAGCGEEMTWDDVLDPPVDEWLFDAEPEDWEIPFS